MAGPIDAAAYDEETCELALAALGALIESGVLGEASRLRPLLRYLVVEELEGRGDRLKAYTIATDVFGRGDDFDPNSDSIVRVEVLRLRQALDHYYATKGAGDPLQIEIPKGTYQPRIRRVETSAAAAPPVAAAKSARPAKGLALWLGAGLAVLLIAGFGAWYLLGGLAGLPGLDQRQPEDIFALEVLPFGALSDEDPPRDLADSLPDEVITGLSRINALTVYVRNPQINRRMPADRPRPEDSTGIGYVVRGSVQRFGGATRVVIHLIEARTGTLLWAQSYNQSRDSAFVSPEEIGAAIAAELRPQIFGAAKRALEAQDPDTLSAWQLYIQATWVPGAASSSLAWEKQRIALAERALVLRPDFGQAHAVLADKLAYLANVDPLSDTPELRAEADYHAQRALELAPADADAMFNVSIHYWHAGRLEEAARATRRTLELDPYHALARMLVQTVPYSCSPPPRSVLQKSVTYDAALSPDNPVRWVTLTWISTLYANNGNFPRAATAARRSHRIFSTPDTTLRFAAILHRLGETGEAVALVEGLRRGWPSLDLRHYAEVTIPRRCGTEPQAKILQALYGDLADAVAARR
ncbi:MAG: hypothetical protein ACFB13_21615 [Kiloniellaceae bacterium]